MKGLKPNSQNSAKINIPPVLDAFPSSLVNKNRPPDPGPQDRQVAMQATIMRVPPYLTDKIAELTKTMAQQAEDYKVLKLTVLGLKNNIQEMQKQLEELEKRTNKLDDDRENMQDDIKNQKLALEQLAEHLEDVLITANSGPSKKPSIKEDVNVRNNKFNVSVYVSHQWARNLHSI